MKKPLTALASLVALCLALLLNTRLQTEAREAAKAQTAKGYVFCDANNNQKFDSGESALCGVRVSNGRDIVWTDQRGRYELPLSDDGIVFVIKPSGWRTPLSEDHLPRFYYVHKPKGSPKLKYDGVAPTGALPDSIDFPLYPQDEPDQFKAILFGDPQPRDQKEIDYIAHDVIEELIGTDASFGVTLGDIMFDDLSLFESGARTVALLGIPWYNVIGNHDINTDAKESRYANETFERVFGPSYYSFDYGTVHFLVLDDIEWVVPEGEGKAKYRGGLQKRQIDFVRNDLANIPENQLVVLLMHIPLTNVIDRQDLYRLIEQRPFCISISGHTHHHEHKFITKADGWMGPEPHHHIINVTVSGSWWSGAPDERRIPHTMMADGAPNGYSIISFDGTDYKLDFKAAGRSKDYQMQITAPEVVAAGKLAETEISVNVFNGSERSKVEMKVGSADRWTVMEHRSMIDPTMQAVYDAEAAIKEKWKEKPWRDMSKPKNSTHIWAAKLSAGVKPGTHAIHIRATDMHGRTYHARRIIRITK